MAGPEAQHSMASAVDPDRDQVLPQALLLTEIMLLVVSGTTAQHLYCPTGLATRRRISVTYHSCMVLPSIENVNSNFPSGHAVPCQLACAVLLLLSPVSWPPNFQGAGGPQPPRSPPPFRSIPPSLLSGALTHHELESLLACIRDKIQQNYHCEHWELQIAAVRCYDCVFSSPSLLPYSSSLPLSLSHHHHCQYHHIVSVVAHVGVLGQGCYGACSPECCALHPSACCNCG